MSKRRKTCADTATGGVCESTSSQISVRRTGWTLSEAVGRMISSTDVGPDSSAESSAAVPPTVSSACSSPSGVVSGSTGSAVV